MTRIIQSQGRGSRLNLAAFALAFVALFVALGGASYAGGLGKNVVKSKTIVNGQVKSGDLADGGVTRAEGFPTRAELVARYEERSGREVGDLRWYTTLALWKSIVFMEGNYRRAVSGSTDDPYLKGFGDAVVELAERAREIAGLSGGP